MISLTGAANTDLPFSVIITNSGTVAADMALDATTLMAGIFIDTPTFSIPAGGNFTITGKFNGATNVADGIDFKVNNGVFVYPIPINVTVSGNTQPPTTNVTVTALQIQPTPDATGVEFVIKGTGFSAASVTLIEILQGTPSSGTSMGGVSIDFISDDTMKLIIVGSVPSGNYYARVTTLSGTTLETPPVNWAGSGGGTTVATVTGFSMQTTPDNTGRAEISVFGTGFVAANVQRVEINQLTATAPVLFRTLQAAEMTVDGATIRGALADQFTAIPAGTYSARVFFTDGTSQETAPFPVGGGGPVTGPQLYGGGVYTDAAGAIKIFLHGWNLPGDITSGMLGDRTISGITVTIEPQDPTKQRIEGTIAVDPATFVEGPYTVTLGTLTFQNVQIAKGSGGGTPTGPQIWSGEIFTDAAGAIKIVLHGQQLPTDITTLTVGGHVVSGAVVSSDPNNTTMQKIEGTIAITLANFVPGPYTVDLTSSTGPQSFPNVQIVLGSGGGGGGAVTVTGFSMQTTPDNTGRAEISVFGTGFVAANIIKVEIYQLSAAAPVLFRTLQMAELTISDNTIRGALAEQFTAIPQGSYNAMVYFTDGSSPTTPPFPIGGGGTVTGPQLWSGEIYSDAAGAIKILLWGKEIPSDVTTLTVGAWTVSGVTVVRNPDDTVGVSQRIEGTIAVDLTTFVSGPFTVSLTASAGPLTFPDVPINKSGGGPGPITGPQIWSGEIYTDAAGAIKLLMWGKDIPTDVTTLTVGQWTVSGVTVTRNPDDTVGVSQRIEGVIAVDLTTFVPGPYAVSLTTSAGPLTFPDVQITKGGGGPGPTGPQIWSGEIFTDNTGAIKILIWGMELPTDITTLMVGTFTVSGVTVVRNPDDSVGVSQRIEGTIAVDLNTFVSGPYAVTATSTAGGTLTFPTVDIHTGGGGPGPGGFQLWGGFFRADSANSAEAYVEINGAEIPRDITAVTIGTWTLVNFTVAANPFDSSGSSMTLSGRIPVDPKTLVEGMYSVTVQSAALGTSTFTIQLHPGGGPGPQGPQVWNGNIYTDASGAIKIVLWGMEIPSDVTALTVGGHTVSGVVITANPDDPSGHGQRIEGTIAIDLATFVSGPYTVDIPTAAGALSFPNIQISTGGGPGPIAGPQIWGGNLVTDGDDVKIILWGKEIPATVTQLTVGGHVVTDLEFSPDPNDPTGVAQRIEGDIAVDPKTFVPGPYTVVVPTAQGELTFQDVQIQVGGGHETGPQIWGGNIFTDAAGALRIRLWGQEIPTDITTLMIGGHVVSGVAVTINPEDTTGASQLLTGTIAIDPRTFVSGPYVVDIPTAQGALNFQNVQIMLNTGGGPGGPQVWNGQIFTDQAGAIKIRLWGKDLPSDITDLNVGGRIVSGAVVTANPNDSTGQSQVITGTIAVDPKTFQQGRYPVKLTSTAQGVLSFADVQIGVGGGAGPGDVAGAVLEAPMQVTLQDPIIVGIPFMDEIRVHNSGTQALTVFNIMTSEGIQAGRTSFRVDPRNEERIPIIIHAGQPGPFTRWIEINSNSVSQGSSTGGVFRITITGTAVGFIESLPGFTATEPTADEFEGDALNARWTTVSNGGAVAVSGGAAQISGALIPTHSDPGYGTGIIQYFGSKSKLVQDLTVTAGVNFTPSQPGQAIRLALFPIGDFHASAVPFIAVYRDSLNQTYAVAEVEGEDDEDDSRQAVSGGALVLGITRRGTTLEFLVGASEQSLSVLHSITDPQVAAIGPGVGIGFDAGNVEDEGATSATPASQVAVDWIRFSNVTYVQTGAGEPKVEVKPEIVEFPNVPIGTGSKRDLVISNPGTARLDITADPVGAPFIVPFATGPSQIFSVPAGEFRNLTVFFQPFAAGSFSDTLTLRTNVESRVINITLRGSTMAEPPVVLEGPVVSELAQTTASIKWKTNRPAGSLVWYRQRALIATADTAAYIRAGDTLLVAEHRVTLTGLLNNTIYSYYIESRDATGGVVNTRDRTGQVFKTLPPLSEVKPPVLTFGPELVDITNSSMLLKMSTDRATVLSIRYGLDTTLANIRTYPDTSRDHTAELTGLTANTRYHFRLRAVDPVSNTTFNGILRTFVTRGAEDTKPPVFMVVPFVDGRTTNSATIYWYTDKATDAFVGFGRDTSAAQSVYDTTFGLEHRVVLSGLGADSVYYFYARSRDRRGLETSTRHKLQSFRTLAARDEAAPVISLGPTVEGRTDSRAIILWQTNEPADGFVEYSITLTADTVFTDFRGLPDFTQTHIAALENLLPDTLYYYRVSTMDRAGNVRRTQVRNFRSLKAADTKPPFLTERPIVLGITQDQATIRWVTDEPSDGYVEFGLDSLYGQETGSTQQSREHLVRLTNLQADSMYHYRIRSTDGSGNTLTGIHRQFRTHAAADTARPVFVLRPAVPFRTQHEAVVVWATNEIATGQLQYGLATNAALDFVLNSSSDPVREHKVTLSDLQPGAEYRYQVRVTDPSNNVTVSDTLRFLTETAADTVAPQLVAGPHAVTRLNQAEIEWVTDEVSDALVSYGQDSTLAEQSSTLDRVRVHKVRLTNLAEGARYFYRLQSTDPSGNRLIRGIFEFRTETSRDSIPPKIIAGPLDLRRTENSATLGWVTSEPSVTEIYYGTTRALGQQYESADLTREHTITLTNLLPDTVYYYVVEAEDVEGNHIFSDTLRFRTTREADTRPPVLLQRPRPKERTSNTAVLAWRTNELSNSIVEFSVDTTFKNIRADANIVTDHQVLLTQLTPGTRYLFRIRSQDAEGNEAMSPVDSFRTQAEERLEPPVLVKPAVVLALSENSATIGWETNRPSDSYVAYGLPGAEKRETGNTNLETQHRVVLTGLQPATSYEAWVRSTDLNQLTVRDTARVIQFRTRAMRDSIPPVIVSLPQVTDRRSDAVRIEWVMDEPGDGFIDYGSAPGALNFATGRPDRDRKQTIFLTGLTADTEYYFAVRSKDAEGNERRTHSSVQQFRTAAAADTSAPKLVQTPIVLNLTTTTATIMWVTDEPADASVIFGGDEANLLQSVESQERQVEHHLVLTDLSPATRYFFMAASTDLAGNRRVTRRIREFRTLALPDTIPPVIMGTPIVFVTDRTAQAHWLTDEPANSFVYFKTVEATEWEKIGDPNLSQEHTVTIANLTRDAEYQFVVVSQDINGNSASFPTAFQGTLFKTLALAKTTQPPGGNGSFRTRRTVDSAPPQIINGPTVLSKSASNVTIQWTTDEQSDSYIQFGAGALTDQKGSSDGATTHEVTLTNLQAGQTYLYKVASTDLNQNGPTQSTDAYVTTSAEEDVTPPRIIDGPDVTALTNEQATIVWETDEPGNSVVEYSLDTTFLSVDTVSGYIRSLSATELVHKVTLTNLLADTLYHFRVQSTDINANGPVTSLHMTFRTTAGPDTLDPGITQTPTVWSLSNNTARIGWGTDELSNSFVRYEPDTSATLPKYTVGQRVNAEELDYVTGGIDQVEDHNVTLTELESNTTYSYIAGSQDASGNEVITSIGKFTTAASADTTPPAEPAGLVAGASNASVQLTWTANTENDLSSYTVYRSVAGGALAAIATGVKQASYTDAGLTNNVAVSYRVTALDNVSPPNESAASAQVSATPSAAAGPSQVSVVTDIVGQAQPVKPLLRVYNATNSDSTFTYDFWIAEDAAFLETAVYETGVPEGLAQTGFIPDVSLVSGRQYYWKARASQGAFTGAWMTATAFTVNGSLALYGAPAAPAQLNAVDQPGDAGTGIRLSFVASANHPGVSGTADDADPVNEYKVYRNTVNNFATATLWQRVAADSSQLGAGDSVVVTVNTQGSAEWGYYWIASEAPGGRISTVIGPNRALAVNNSGLAADLSGNAEVDIFDVAIIAAVFGNSVEYDAVFDLSGNGEVDIFDVAKIAEVFGQTAGKRAVAAAEPAPGVNADAAVAVAHTLEPNGRVKLDAVITGARELLGFQMTLHYDQAQYRFLGFEEGPFMTSTKANALVTYQEAENGQIHVFGVLLGDLPEAIPAGEGLLGSLSFLSTGGGAQDIRIDRIKLLDARGGLNAIADAVVESPAIPVSYDLFPNFPNPFNPSTTLRFSLPQAGRVHLSIFNILGQEIKVLADEDLEAGFHNVVWDGKNRAGLQVASGVYLVRIQAGSFVKTRKMLLVK